MKLGIYFLLLAGLHAPAWAADKETTRQLTDMQAEVRAQESRISRLEAALQKNEQVFNLMKEVDTLKAEIAKLRGDAEVQTHLIETLEKRQKDLYVDLDNRVTELNKVATAPPAAKVGANVGTATADPTMESSDYEAALNAFKARDYNQAISGFKSFLKNYPDSALAPNAQYWIGYAYYSLKDYKSALAQQQKLIAVYPASAKVPDALLSIASAQIETRDKKAAKRTLEEIIVKYPGSTAAALAAKRLVTLK
ncbi:MAG: tol-pal system protein YbgF [Thiobacillus sp.]